MSSAAVLRLLSRGGTQQAVRGLRAPPVRALAAAAAPHAAPSLNPKQRKEMRAHAQRLGRKLVVVQARRCVGTRCCASRRGVDECHRLSAAMPPSRHRPRPSDTQELFFALAPQVGKNGLTPNVSLMVDEALTAHEIVKASRRHRAPLSPAVTDKLAGEDLR